MMSSNQAILFPGQGAQRPGMGAAVLTADPFFLAQAEHFAGFSIGDFFRDARPDHFNNTRYLQPALYTLNAMYYRRYLAEGGALPSFFAGHSLGEFNALHAANVYDFDTGLRLVKQRAQLMSESRGGGMTAVLGLTAAEVAQIIAQQQWADISIANDNADLQIVVSGPLKSLQRAEAVFYDHNAVNCVPLRVSGAFHCAGLIEAARQFADYLQGFVFSTPSVPVIANRTATPYTLSSLVQNLAQHIVQPVLWRQSIIAMRKQGVAQFIEMGESTLLSSMVKNIAFG